jgi:hypothetical protein
MSSPADTATGDVIEAPPLETPAWTREQLTYRLLVRFGPDRHGQVDQVAVQQALGVSRRTLRRWLHGDPTEVVGMMDANRSKMHAALLPSKRTLRQEKLDENYARQAVKSLARRRRRGILPAWSEQRWLEPHLVAVLEHRPTGMRQIAVARTDGRVDQLKRRGEVLDFVEVPTRFDATLLVAAVLEVITPWRVVAAKSLVGQGNTIAWSPDAPIVDLSAVAFEHELRTWRT